MLSLVFLCVSLSDHNDLAIREESMLDLTLTHF